jgi:hypothetical protein
VSKLPPRGRIDYEGLPFGKPKRGDRPRKGLERRTRIAPVNTERQAARHEDIYGRQFKACASLPCIGCGKVGRSTGHHEPDVSIGGRDEHTVPVCWGYAGSCHDRLHEDPLGWWREVDLDPAVIQQAVRDWMASGKPPSLFMR